MCHDGRSRLGRQALLGVAQHLGPETGVAAADLEERLAKVSLEVDDRRDLAAVLPDTDVVEHGGVEARVRVHVLPNRLASSKSPGRP